MESLVHLAILDALWPIRNGIANPIVDRADREVLATEARDLCAGDCSEWLGCQEPVPGLSITECWGPREAEERFLSAWASVAP